MTTVKLNIIKRLQGINKAIRINTDKISELYDTIQVYRDVIKKDEDDGKLNNVFSYAPLKRANALIHEMHTLKGINRDLRSQKKVIKHHEKSNSESIQHVMGFSG